MGVQDIIAITIAAGALAYVARLVWRGISGKAGCSCGSADDDARCTASIDRTGLRQAPLIQINPPDTHSADDPPS